MAHCLFRLYTEAQPDPTRFERLRSEMLPKLRNIAGFQRFSGLRTRDGRYGGFQVYDTRAGLDQAVQMLNAWRASTGQHGSAAIEAFGEVGLSIVVNPDYDKGYGVARIYRTDAPFEAMNAAIEQEASDTIRHLPGMLRYTTAKLDDGRVAVFAACSSEDAATAMSEKARELRHRSGSQLAHVLPADPEVIPCDIVYTMTKASVPEPA